ncbi:hypothetical protein OIU74_003157 [Salix koriyanagi]|uniref:Uncharacterized protein n=1 Tax=Salix koriyanagi TaxID=2511006 RepID=A0A9Q0ZKY3_9ROSI|nr:hypothetical protein OIU74_003157 [Salix koriyanagi]
MRSLYDVKGLESSLLPVSSMDSTQLSRGSSPLLPGSQLASHSPFRTLRLMKMNRLNKMKMIEFLIPLLSSPVQVLDSSLPVFPSPTLSGPPAGHHILCKPSTPRAESVAIAAATVSSQKFNVNGEISPINLPSASRIATDVCLTRD